MTALRLLLAALSLAVVAHVCHAESKAWQDTITLPTWIEGAPDIHPQIGALDAKPDPFDLHSSFYPYTARLNFTAVREPQVWRRLNLENEYLSCSFLPDLGGHLYTCIDKRNGHPIFRVNPSVKKADVGPRGAWVAMGVEFSFPVAHARDTVSPVDFAVRQEKDHAEVWLGDTDRVTGMEWVSEFVLRDGSAALEQRVTLRNPTSVRHPYLWWANADLDLDEGARFVYPAGVMASHGVTDLYSWPRSKAGADLSKPFNVSEELCYFAYGSREPFIAVYNASSRTATVHVADPSIVTGKKLYHWGRTGLAWARQHLSDTNSGYVEMQAGLFGNQEIREFLEPLQQVEFTEWWMGGRELNGVTRANEQAILSFERVPGARGNNLVVQLNAVRSIPGAQISIVRGSSAVWQDKSDLSPAKTYEHTFPNPEKGVAYRFELRDANGKLLMLHTEGTYEAVTSESVKLGPQPSRAPGSRRESATDFLAAAEQDEKYSLFHVAESEYREGSKKFPGDVRLKEALGRLLATRNRYAEAAQLLSEAAQTRMLDPELRYYLGLALAFSGKEEDARRSWIAAVPDGRFGPSALIGLASLEARGGNSSAALDFAQKAIDRRPSLLVARKLQVALLRHAGRDAEALQRLNAALALDPLDSFLRFEATRLGAKDDALWPHLAADPERVLNLVDTYFKFGLFADALELLSRQYQAAPANQAEPGAVLLQADALASYYRGYCLLKLGRDAGADFKLAASQPLEYVFPHRASTRAVLAAALQVNANDASAHYLTGLLDLDQNRPADAIPELQAALAIRKDIPALHYVLGRALLLFNDRRTEAVAVLKEGISLNPSDKTLKSLLEEKPSAPVTLPPIASVAAKPPVTGTPATPEELVQQALNLSAEGESANGIFNEHNFPQERQPESVRWAYIEVQLQALRRRAAQKDCSAVLSGVDSIGGNDGDVPFTARGFEDLLKGARVQYFLGAVESLCGQAKSAQSRWTKVARLKPPAASADFAFPAIAAQSLAQKGGAFDLGPWLDQANKALNDGAEAKGLLDYSKGILLLAAGDERGAMAAFNAGAGEPDHDFSQYLNRAALAEAHRAAQPVR